MKTDTFTLVDLREDLKELLSMTEQEACIKYNVDSKKEAIQIIQEWISSEEQYEAENSKEELLPYSFNIMSKWAGLTL